MLDIATKKEHIKIAENVLLELSEEVGAEARQCNYKGKTVSIVMKFNDFQSVTRQKSIQPTYLTKDIYQAGVELLKENWSGSRPIRLLGISISNFQDTEVEQLSFLNELGLEVKKEKEEKLEKAIDAIRERFGNDKIKRAKVYEKGSKK